MVTLRGIAFQRAPKRASVQPVAGREAKRITGVRFPQNKIEKTDVENVRNFFGDSKGNRLSASAKRASVQPVAGREAKRITGVRFPQKTEKYGR